MDTTNAFALRGVVKKPGLPDRRFELRRNQFDFSVIVNGAEIGRYYRTYSPQQLMRGDCPPMGIEEAWQGCMARYFPGHEATNMESLS